MIRIGDQFSFNRFNKDGQLIFEDEDTNEIITINADEAFKRLQASLKQEELFDEN